MYELKNIFKLQCPFYRNKKKIVLVTADLTPIIFSNHIWLEKILTRVRVAGLTVTWLPMNWFCPDDVSCKKFCKILFRNSSLYFK